MEADTKNVKCKFFNQAESICFFEAEMKET